MSSMDFVSKIVSNMRYFYNEINPATLTGAIDVVVVEQPDGTFTCSPFHVRFGKIGVLRSSKKPVDLELNGLPVNIHMKLGESGEAFFVEEVPEDEMESSAHLATSPIPEGGFLYSPTQEVGTIPRRNSADALDKYQNQISDYSQRRHTDSQSIQKPDLTSQKREYQMMKETTYVPSTNSSQQDTMFSMDGLDDQLDNTTTGAAKMFKAEELNDKDSHAKEVVRKISINNDFRPISIVNEPNLSPTEESKMNADENKENTIGDTPNGAKNGSKKKKKTKKSASKKKNQRKSSNSSSNGYSSQSEATVPEPDDNEKTESERLSGEQEDITPPPGFTQIQDVHFFSDTDIATDKRQDGTPVQSDSELELARGSGANTSEASTVTCTQSWRWGELPSPPPLQGGNSSSESQGQSQADGKTKCEGDSTPSLTTQGSSSMLSGMLKFIKPSRGAQNSVEEGKYLDDLAAGSVDPEVAALYFPQHSQGNNSSQTDTINVNSEMLNEDDYESGNGPSLPQSPSSVEGPIGKRMDFDEDDIKIFCKGYVGLSLCGDSSLQQSLTTLTELFEREAINYDTLCSDPSVLQNPKLVVRIGDQYMPWATAAPILISLLVFHRPLPKNIIEKSLPAAVDAKPLECKTSNQESSLKSGKTQGGYTSWWYWRRSNDKQTSDVTKSKEDDVTDGGIAEHDASTTNIQEKLTIIDQDTDLGDDSTKNECDSPQEVSTQTSFPLLSGGGGGVGGSYRYSGSQSSEDSYEGGVTIGGISQGGQSKSSTERFRKTLRLSSEQIGNLNLKEGMNEMKFSVTTAFQGTSICKCHIFRWRYDDKIVISDIDGTITKSDVLGHIFPMIGKDWAQSGVAQLFTKIKNNGYKLLYLSARAIGQAKVTRDYLRSIKQGDLSLPDGPLLLNPTSLLRAFHTEVIEKKPEEFKIRCLTDVLALFPEGAKPYFAGYGNKPSDVCAYQAVGIPIVRIFTINHKGELKHELTQTFQSSYSNMSYIVDHLFPPVRGDACEDFSEFNYWRNPVESLPCLSPPTPLSGPQGLPPIPEGASD